MSIQFHHYPYGSIIGSGTYIFRHYGNEFTAYITVNFPSDATCTCVGGSESYTTTTTPYTFTVHAKTTYTITATNSSGSASDTVSITTEGQTASVTLVIYPRKSFSNCTLAEINTICEAGLAASYVSSGVWSIGDTNTRAGYGSYKGIRLVHVLTDTQRGSSYYNTTGHIVVQFLVPLLATKYMSSNTAQNYFSGALHAACNSTIYNGMTADLRSIVKPWTCRVGVANGSSGSTSGTTSATVYLAAPSCKEMGKSNEFNSSENSACFTFSYSTASCSTGATSLYWLRSPSNYVGSYYAYRIQCSSGSLYDDVVNYAGPGARPICVI